MRDDNGGTMGSVTIFVREAGRLGFPEHSLARRIFECAWDNPAVGSGVKDGVCIWHNYIHMRMGLLRWCSNNMIIWTRSRIISRSSMAEMLDDVLLSN